MKMKHTAIFIFLLSLTTLLSAMTPEIQQAIALWESGKVADAFPILLKYKDSDDADALAYLGRSYMNGRGVDKNASLAFEYFSKAAAKNHPYGLNGLGVCYESGMGVKQDLQKAERYFLAAAKANCPLAELNLGMLYQGGFEVAEGTPSIPDFGNAQKAIEHFRASYDAGNFKDVCVEQIGILMQNSETKQPQEAIKWLEKDAEDGQEIAIRSLASWYENGIVVPVNYNKAIDFAERLGKLTKDYRLYADICYRVGIEYMFLQKEREAMLFLQKAADAGHADAQYQMFLLHPDENEMGKYALMAVKNGVTLCRVQAGTYLARQKRFDEAMKVYLEAARDGDLQAMCEIAIMHRIGEGVPVDYEKAMGWYEKAAKQYHPRALRELGVKYLIKYDEDPKKQFYKNIPPSLSKAYAYMAMAVFLGDEDEPAREKLPGFPYFQELRKIVPADSDMELSKGLICIYYGKVDADLDEGLKLLEKSAAHGNVDAMNMLGYLYSLPNAPCKDLGKAVKHYKRAAASGNDYAARQLCDSDFGPIMGKAEYTKCLQAQAAKGYDEALYHLAGIYEEAKEFQKADELHCRNARKGFDFAIARLNEYPFMNRPLPMDAEELAHLVQQSLARHCRFIEYDYSIQCDLRKNFREAAVYAMRSYLDGYRRSGLHFNLAIMFLKGKGVMHNPEVGVAILEEGIQRGYHDLIPTLGHILAKGENGATVNKKRAMELFKIGAKQHRWGCKEALEELQKEMEKEGE